MKRLLCMIFALIFVGVGLTFSVSAETKDEPMQVIPVSSNIILKDDVFVENTDKIKTTLGVSGGLWCKEAITIDSTTKNTVTDLHRLNISLNIPIKVGTDTFMFYVSNPDFLENTAALSLFNITVSQDSVLYKLDIKNAEYTYLNIRENAWENGKIHSDGAINSLGANFRGYIKFNLKDIPAFKEVNIDFSKDYNVSALEFGVRHIGGYYKSMNIGGFYSVIKDTNSPNMVNFQTNETSLATIIAGDLDFNGEVQENDLILGKKAIINEVETNGAMLERADVKQLGDGFTVDDLVHLKKKIKGYYSPEKIIEFKLSTSEKDSMLVAKNPDRGFRMKSFIELDKEPFVSVNLTQWDKKFEYAANESAGKKVWYNPTVNKVYLNLSPWYNKDLEEIAFKSLQEVFDIIKKQGRTVIIRFYYASNFDSSNTKTGYVPVTQNQMFRHMEQIKENGILERNKDVLNCVEAGFLGLYGEWHTYYLPFWDVNKVNGILISEKIWNNPNNSYDEALIIRRILDMVPEEIPVLLRTSDYRDMYLESKYAKKGDAERLGLKNDAFFGYRYEPQAWPYYSMDNASSISAYYASFETPSSGECFWGREYVDENGIERYDRLTAEEAILAFKYFHQNTFAVFHNSWEGTTEVSGGPNGLYGYTEREGDMSIWSRTEMDENWLKENNIFYSPNWFVDKDGNRVSKTQFEFVRDYLGYKLEGKKLKLSGKIQSGEKIGVELSLVNYGFSAAFNMESEFVILDKKNKIVSSVKAGNPLEWNNTCALELHKISSRISLPEESGSYKLAFYLHNRAGTGAYLGNDIEHYGEYNILYEFEI